MGLEKFRREDPINEGYINLSLVYNHFFRMYRDLVLKGDDELDGPIDDTPNGSAFIGNPKCAFREES